MKSGLHEATQVHSRLLKCTLQVEESRAYWAQTSAGAAADPSRAFEEYWFGAKSLARVEVLLSNLRLRFDAFPAALGALQRWQGMSPDTRKLICHWHLQLVDPLYRSFTGEFLVRRREGSRQEVSRDLVVHWVGEHGPLGWTLPTRVEFASKLLSSAFAAGLVGSNRDPRPLVQPPVTDDALEYLMYLLREVAFEGTALENPYLASVGLGGSSLEARLAGLSGLAFLRQGDLIEFGWCYPDLDSWADGKLVRAEVGSLGGTQ